MRKAIYPGSFDPITNGHIDIIKRMSNMYDKVVVLVGTNPGKKYTFEKHNRKMLVEQAINELELHNIEVVAYEGLIIDYAVENDCQVIVKGLRSVTDYEYELSMALVNRDVNPEVETLFMVADHNLSMVSSSMVKELAKNKCPIDKYTTKLVVQELKNVYFPEPYDPYS